MKVSVKENTIATRQLYFIPNQQGTNGEPLWMHVGKKTPPEKVEVSFTTKRLFIAILLKEKSSVRIQQVLRTTGSKFSSKWERDKVKKEKKCLRIFNVKTGKSS